MTKLVFMHFSQHTHANLVLQDLMGEHVKKCMHSMRYNHFLSFFNYGKAVFHRSLVGFPVP